MVASRDCGTSYADVLLAGSLHRGGPDGLSARPIVTLAGRSARALEVVPIGDANADGHVEVIIVLRQPSPRPDTRRSGRRPPSPWSMSWARPTPLTRG
ncbi:MAG: hypothetical protein ABI134_15980 [Byssovorax sp.]